MDDILALTDEDGYDRIGAQLLCSWINNELTTAWGWIGRANRDIITKATSQFSLSTAQGAAGYSMTATAPTGLALADFFYPRGVDILVGGTTEWKPIRKWSFTTRNQVYSLCYRFVGEKLYVQPSDQAATYPYRVWYVYSPPQVSASAPTTAISIPDNLDEYIKQGVAAKVRTRLDDDPSPHQAAQAATRAQIISLLRSNGGDQAVIADVFKEGVYF